MWLRISFFADKPSFLAVVALDGNIYFKTSDLGKFLGYSNIFNFARRYGTKDLYKLIPSEFIPQHHLKHSNTKCPVMRFNDIIRVIRKCIYRKRNDMCLFNEERVEDLQALWLSGTLSTDTFPHDLPLSPLDAFQLNVQPNGIGNIRLKEWIRKFANETVKMFNRSKNTEEAMEFYTNLMSDGIQTLSDPHYPQHKDFSINLDDNCVSSPPNASNEDVPPSVDQDDDYLSPPSVLNPEQDDDYLPPPSVFMPEQEDDTPPSVLNPEDPNQLSRIFEMKYDGLTENLPDEIHVMACGMNHVYVKH